MPPSPAPRGVYGARTFLTELERVAAEFCASVGRDDEVAARRNARPPATAVRNLR